MARRLVSATFVRQYRKHFLNDRGEPLRGKEVWVDYLAVAVKWLQRGDSETWLIEVTKNAWQVDLGQLYQDYLAKIAAKKRGERR